MYTEIHMYCCLIPLQTDLRFRSTKKPQARTNAESLASAESTGLGEVKLQQNMYVTCMQPESQPSEVMGTAHTLGKLQGGQAHLLYTWLH